MTTHVAVKSLHISPEEMAHEAEKVLNNVNLQRFVMDRLLPWIHACGITDALGPAALESRLIKRLQSNFVFTDGERQQLIRDISSLRIPGE